MITQDDLHWWLDTAAKTSWTWAKTYATIAPHDYVVEGRTAGLHHADYVRAARVIHTFGQPGKYYGITNIYLEDDATGMKWWTMDADVTKTNLINRAVTARLYGVQNAHSTFSGLETFYDTSATSYDVDHPISGEVAEQVRDAMRLHNGPYPPVVLDVGCGTGRVLDLGLASPDRYAGLDPSTPMLNQLVRKHPGVARLYPTTIERALSDGLFTPRQFDIVTLMVDERDRFGDETLAEVAGLASKAFIHVNGHDVTVHAASALVEASP